MSVKLLTEHHLEFLRLKGGCTGSSESTLAKMPHCSKSHVTAHFEYFTYHIYPGYSTILILVPRESEMTTIFRQQAAHVYGAEL